MSDPAVRPPVHEVRAVVARALAEDLTPLGDLTSALLPAGLTAAAVFATRADGVLAGTDGATEAFAQVDPTVRVTWTAGDGDRIAAGQVVGTVEGPLASILTAERTALNLLCHLSGVATLTRRFVDAAAAGGPTRVWDTRKTLPGLRSLEKAAVRAGGAVNHRGNLSDWVLFKDNHLSVLGIEVAVTAARDRWPGRLVHVEVGTADELAQALGAGVDAVLLDNHTPAQAAEAVRSAEAWAADHGGRRPLIECSGGITVDNAAAYAATGVDFLSSGQLTMSAPALDLGLDL